MSGGGNGGADECVEVGRSLQSQGTLLQVQENPWLSVTTLTGVHYPTPSGETLLGVEESADSFRLQCHQDPPSI